MITVHPVEAFLVLGRGAEARVSEGLNLTTSRPCERGGPLLEGPPLSALRPQHPKAGSYVRAQSLSGFAPGE